MITAVLGSLVKSGSSMISWSLLEEIECNIFLSVKFQKADGTTKILVAAIRRKIFLVEFQYMENYMEPLTKELFFTCIQAGSEISSIDILNRSKTADDFVVGVVVLKKSDACISASLNLYTEYDSTSDTVVTLDSIGQSCEVLTLHFTPYGLHHAEISPSRNNGQYENLWLLPGSDYKIHAYRCFYEDRRHCEVTLEDYFPEFVDLTSVALSLKVFYYNKYQNRISCVGCEDGYVRCCIVNSVHNTVLRSLVTYYENPVSCVQFFTMSSPQNYPNLIPEDDGTKTPENTIPDVNLLVVNTIYHSEVFMDLINHGFEKKHCLMESTMCDTCLCSVVADIDFDGLNEIILGTYGESLLLFKYKNEKWVFVEKKSMLNPVHKLFYEDLTEDGVCELIGVTSKGVHIYQHQLKKQVLPLLHARLKRLTQV